MFNVKIVTLFTVCVNNKLTQRLQALLSIDYIKIKIIFFLLNPQYACLTTYLQPFFDPSFI